MKLTLRNEVDRPLSYTEVDNNFRFLHFGIWVNRILLLVLLVIIVLQMSCAHTCVKECCPEPGHGPCPICEYDN